MAQPTRRTRRLNARALIVLAALAVVAVPGLIGLKAMRDRGGRSAYLAEAKTRLAGNQPALALGYLNRYLELNPNDLDALDLKGKVLADAARDEAQALEAVQVHSQVLGRSPDAPGRQATRRRLVRLNLMIPGRARAAEAQAREMIKRGDGDAEAHRLLAHALELSAVAERKPEVMDEARREYEAAEARDPGDVEGAERLAALYRDRLDDPAKARAVLDRLVAATAPKPKTHAAARLARARHFQATRQPDLASADVGQALKDDPGHVEVRLAAAEDALRRRDPAAARRHLAAVAPSEAGDLRVRITEGLIDLAERRPDDAIKHWRAGLVKAGGGDAELTWRLAHVLLETGRVADAEPLIDQYRRLVGGEEPPLRYRYLHALALLKTNRPGEAVAGLEAIRYKIDKAVEPHVYFALGEGYEAVREPAKALEAYRQSADLSQGWGAPWAAVARLQIASKPADAVVTLLKGLALNPDDTGLLISLAGVLWREQAQKPKPDRNWSAFERALDQARKAAPGSPELALVEADYLASNGRTDEAAARLRTAAARNPKATELWLAQANALARAGRPGRALGVIDEAIASAGPQAGLVITRASLLVTKGLMREARAALVDGAGRVPDGQKPLMWKALGDFDQNRGDLASARSAYEAWARVQPGNPEPRLALVELALAADDDATAAREVEALRGVGGPKSYYWRLARVEVLLRERPGGDARGLDEAGPLIAEIQANDPQLPLGYLLEARLRERRGQTDKAVAAYEKAVRLNAGQAALTPLVALLVREGRDADLNRLREALDGQAGDVDRLAALQALRQGNATRAERLAALAVQGDPRGLDARVWQAEVLRALGKPAEAEAALKVLVARKPDEPAPWLQLLMLQVGRREPAEAAATVEQIRARVKSAYPELLWAVCYRATGDLPRAGECYQKALARWPDDPGVLASAAGFFEETGRKAEAESALRALRRRDPADAWAARKLALLLAARPGGRAAWDEALALVGAGPRPDDVPDDVVARAGVYAQGPEPSHRRNAVAILEGVLAELPHLAAVHEQLARLLYAAGDASGARDHAARAAEGERASPDAILFYAGVLLTRNDVSGAEVQLARLAAIDPAALPVAEIKARVLAARGRADEGAKVLERAFDDRAASPEAFPVGEKTVRLLLSLNQPEAAARVARRLAELGQRGKCLLAELRAAADPAEADRLLVGVAGAGDPLAAGTAALALALRPGADRRWLPLADRFLADAARARPGTTEVLDRVALLRHLQGRFDDEVAAYHAMLAQGPADVSFLNNLAWTLSEELGRPEEGLRWADEAVKRLGARPHVLDTRGVILIRLGRHADALRDLEAAARDLPTASVYYHLARAYQKAGRPDDVQKARRLARQAGLARESLQRSEAADYDAVMAP